MSATTTGIARLSIGAPAVPSRSSGATSALSILRISGLASGAADATAVAVVVAVAGALVIS